MLDWCVNIFGGLAAIVCGFLLVTNPPRSEDPSPEVLASHYDQGYEEGVVEGYKEGRNEGYKEGVKRGFEEGDVASCQHERVVCQVGLDVCWELVDRMEETPEHPIDPR